MPQSARTWCSQHEQSAHDKAIYLPSIRRLLHPVHIDCQQEVKCRLASALPLTFPRKRRHASAGNYALVPNEKFLSH